METLEFSSLSLSIEIVEIKEDKVLLVSFNGQITNTNAYEINQSISQIFKGNIFNLILDLTNLQYINSIGVATLLGMIKTVEQNGGVMLLGGLNHFLENVIKLMDLPRHVKIHQSREDAIKNWPN